MQNSALGVTWSNQRQQLLVHGDFNLATVSTLSRPFQWNYQKLQNSYSAVTVAEPVTTFAYLAQSWPPSIDEVNVNSGEVIRTFSLSAPGAFNDTAALTFVKTSNPDGEFWIAPQGSNSIFVFELQISNPSSTFSTYLRTFSVSDKIKGLSYVPGQPFVHSLTSDWIYTIPTQGSDIKSTFVGATKSNTFALVPSTSDVSTVYLSPQSSSVWKFQFSFEKGIDSGQCVY